MKIFNAMFSKVNGGLEQVFLNYNRMLAEQGHEVIPIIHPDAQIRPQCDAPNLKLVHNFNQYDPLAILRLRRLVVKEKPDCIITHSYRASYLFQKTFTRVPKIAVCHTNSHFDFGSDALIALTPEMKQSMVDSGWSPSRVFVVPNMISIPEDLTYREPRDTPPPIIGACARMVHIKGLDVFIDALAELKRRGVPFKARIAGDGKERVNYIQRIQERHLTQDIELLGWVDDTAGFYDSIDIFCLPSREETFGMVVLEGMLHSLPMVLTDLTGPQNIIGETSSALMVPPEDPITLADALQKLITDKTLAQTLSKKAFERVQAFSNPRIAPILDHALQKCMQITIMKA